MDGEKHGNFWVAKATTRKEINEIMDVIWAANYLPYEPAVQLFFPVLGYLPEDRGAAVIESKERFWKNHQADPSSNWFYVRDPSNYNAIVGCAQWEIHLSNPFSDGEPKLQAPWWPQGEYREFCESILNQIYTPRVRRMTKPHVGKSSPKLHVLLPLDVQGQHLKLLSEAKFPFSSWTLIRQQL